MAVILSTLPVQREASGNPPEGASRDRGFSVVTGGRTSSFRDLSVGEALAFRLLEERKTNVFDLFQC